MTQNTPSSLSKESILSFRRGYRLKKPKNEGQALFILGPERGWECSQTAGAVIEQLDGQASLWEITEKLAKIYQASPEIILADMIELLTPLLQRGIFAVSPATNEKTLHG